MPLHFRLVLADPKLFPVQAFFNAISDGAFVRVVESLLSGVGHGAEEAFCEFPDPLDPGDPPFEGVRFSIFEEEVVLDRPTFLRYLRLAVDAFLEGHPADRVRLEALLRAGEAGDSQQDKA